MTESQRFEREMDYVGLKMFEHDMNVRLMQDKNRKRLMRSKTRALSRALTREIVGIGDPIKNRHKIESLVEEIECFEM